jgi:hypothetical protein
VGVGGETPLIDIDIDIASGAETGAASALSSLNGAKTRSVFPSLHIDTFFVEVVPRSTPYSDFTLLFRSAEIESLSSLIRSSIMMSRSSRLIVSSAVRNLSKYPLRPLSISHPIVSLQRTFTSSSVKMGDAISEKPHNAWLGAKGPAALDLRSM